MYHVHNETLEIIECLGNCKLPKDAHYFDKADALEAAAISKELSKLALESKEINFRRGKSAKTGLDFLEASLRTPFEQDAIFTVEELAEEVRGSLYIEGQEYILARDETNGDSSKLHHVAKSTVQHARKFHNLDIWPSGAVVDLYYSFEANSTPHQLFSPLLQLTRVDSGVSVQYYLGETLTGVDIAIKVAKGYAIAEIDSGSGLTVVHEANLSQQFFLTTHERNIFAAKAFGDLLKSGSI